MITKENFTDFLCNTGSEVRSQYNRVVTNFALAGVNEASNDLIIAITTTGYFGSQEQKMMINTLLHLLSLEAPVQENTVPQWAKFWAVDQNPNWKNSLKELPAYVPDFPEWASAWAVDNDGCAFFHKNVPTRAETVWYTKDWSCDNPNSECDSDFRGSDFPMLWQGEAWKSSLKIKQHKGRYVPQFPDWATHWAVDGDGTAYFYTDCPVLSSSVWSSDEEYERDYYFLAEEHPDMWKNEAWKRSQIVG